MNAGRAFTQQLFALPRGVFNAELRRCFIVVTALFEFVEQWLGQAGAAQGGELLDLRGAEDGNDSRHNGNRDAQVRKKVAELEVIAVAEEKLRDHKIRAAIDLVFQPLPVHVFAFLAGDVSFGKAGHADGKPARLTNELHQLIGKLESALGHFELARAAGRVAAQRQNVVDAARARYTEVSADFLFCGVDASQVRHGGEAVLPLNAVHDRQRLVPRAAARAVGDGTEIRLELPQRGDRLFEKDALALFGLGRKKHEGDDRTFGRPGRRVDVADEIHGADDERNCLQFNPAFARENSWECTRSCLAERPRTELHRWLVEFHSLLSTFVWPKKRSTITVRGKSGLTLLIA